MTSGVPVTFVYTPAATVDRVGHRAGLPRRQQLPAERHRAIPASDGPDDSRPTSTRPASSPRRIRASRSATRRVTACARPWFWQLDASLSKQIVVRERRAKVEMRLEAFNLFNRTNFQAPNGNRSSGGFGTITSTYDARQLQLGVKFLW